MELTNSGRCTDGSGGTFEFTHPPHTASNSFSFFDLAYESKAASWVIGEPQPAITALEREGWIRGTVLDIGCGTGEHTIHLARLGYEITGIDSSRAAIKRSKENALIHNVTVRFHVADALRLIPGTCSFDTIIDSALFHEFDPGDRSTYVRNLYSACRPGGYVHVLAMSDIGPRFGPQISDTAIREAFSPGWIVEEIKESRYRVFVDSQASSLHGIPEGKIIDASAWLARIRQTGVSL
ncbi:class I SAM-dependent methyltransferase [Nocardia sp. BSTN01]|uniref:class I SAM-dependent methyltransferase n=1 Tax=Nocardia sp. BSTN01 TaxID=2783665 RepID=UPI00188FC7E8|nr:class I SAM-dependent methyltransferase [Nocardia sp. BSTN01]MBF5001532.1 class I SAM-dependent methyltransferase [Nocardia sp. BSTN01]